MNIDMIKKIVIVGAAILIFFVGKYALHLQSDSPIEQGCEEIIKEETGVDVNALTASKS
jgi:uncharacterized protein involved in high-affinity Fe2+ transport